MTALSHLVLWVHIQLLAVRTRAQEEADVGEIVEKVIIVAAAAAIAIGAMAAIAAAVDMKIGSLKL